MNEDLRNLDRKLLHAIDEQKNGSVLNVRATLKWEAEKFAVTLQKLQRLELIRRDGHKAVLTNGGRAALMQPTVKQKNRADDSPSFMTNRIYFAQQLEVNEFYLPNAERFLRSWNK